MNKIEGFSRYSFLNGEVLDLKTNKPRKVYKDKKGKLFLKLFNNNGVLKNISLSTVKSLAGMPLELPPDAVPIKGASGYFVDTLGNIYSFRNKKSGEILKHTIHHCGYVYVNIYFDDGSKKNKTVHGIVARAFYDENYSDELCCLHLDDDKTNPALSNLKIGTYSENNKSAYDNGLNRGRKRG